MSEHLEDELDNITVEDLETLHRKIALLGQFIEIADRASHAYHDGKLLEAGAALRDYHALRTEHARQ